MQPRARRDLAARQADDVGDPAVQRDEPARPGPLVQAVDVLGDEEVGVDRRERAVAGVRLGALHPGPAEVAARPVALLGRRPGHELLVGHHARRRRPAQRRLLVGVPGPGAAVVGDARVRRDARAGQDDERPVREEVEDLGHRSPGVPELRPGPRLGGLDLAVLGRRGRHQVVDEVPGDVRDLADRLVEHGLVGRRRLGRAGDLAHELQGRRVDLVVGRGRLEVVEGADVPAHGPSVRRGRDAYRAKNSASRAVTSTTRPSGNGTSRTW